MEVKYPIDDMKSYPCLTHVYEQACLNNTPIMSPTNPKECEESEDYRQRWAQATGTSDIPENNRRFCCNGVNILKKYYNDEVFTKQLCQGSLREDTLSVALMVVSLILFVALAAALYVLWARSQQLNGANDRLTPEPMTLDAPMEAPVSAPTASSSPQSAANEIVMADPVAPSPPEVAVVPSPPAPLTPSEPLSNLKASSLIGKSAITSKALGAAIKSPSRVRSPPRPVKTSSMPIKSPLNQSKISLKKSSAASKALLKSPKR